MAENENTRFSSKKRPTAAHSAQLSKKRVPLAELTNTEWPRDLDCQTRVPEYTSKEDDSSTSESTKDSDVETSRNQKPKSKVKERNQKGPQNSSSPESTRNWELKKCCYSTSIYGYLQSLEIGGSRRCLANYMEEVQTEISVNMREILVDWLVEVAEEYKLVSETIYLTVSYIDRFLSSQALCRNKLQLLGVSCMLIASKYEEISPPHVEDLCYMTDNTYTKEEVVDMEKDVLKLLNYEMSTPTTKSFLRTLTQAAYENCSCPDFQFEFLSSYLAELSLLEYRCVHLPPSIIAASAVFLSRFTIQPNEHPWNMELQRRSGYKVSELKECVTVIHDLQLNRKGSTLRAVRDKYMQHKFKYVAALSPPTEFPVHYFEAIDE